MLTLKNKIVTLRELKKINKNSIETELNRTIDYSIFAKILKNNLDQDAYLTWRGLNTTILLKPLMIHTHKNDVKTEPHIRCEVFTNGMFPSFLTLDLTKEDFAKLANAA